MNRAADRQTLRRQNLIEFAALLLLIGGGVAVRLLFRDLPNFAPVAALALFAGYFFRSARVALLVPLCVMAISDIFIGFHQWYMMVIVYGSLSLPVAMRGLLRRRLRMQRGKLAQAAGAVAALLACGFVSSLLFFAISNLGAWFWMGSYALTPTGLLECYAAALPFFRFTLTGDAIFALTLFGGYALALQLGLVVQSDSPPRLAADSSA